LGPERPRFWKAGQDDERHQYCALLFPQGICALVIGTNRVAEKQSKNLTAKEETWFVKFLAVSNNYRNQTLEFRASKSSSNTQRNGVFSPTFSP
jgi:hypothetical protein